MLTALFLTLAMFELGPKLGEAVPRQEVFAREMGEKGATIVFVRSVDWCPFCKKQVIELSSKAEAFEQAGRPLIFVSYDSEKTQVRFAEVQMLGTTFVSDEGSEVIKAFGILNETHKPGSRAYGIPHPAVFVVDKEGVVRAKLYEEDYATNAKSYRDRPAVETILSAAENSL